MKSIFFLLLSFTLSFAQVQTVRVGEIDQRYNHLVSEDDLIYMIKEIETLFETELGFNVFDYSQNGKPIDILYIPPSQKKKRILKNQKKSELLKKKIDDSELFILNEHSVVEVLKSQLGAEYDILNSDIERLNSYVATNNASKNLSKSEYETIKSYVSKEQASVIKRKKDLELKKRKANRSVVRYKNKVRKHNALVRKYNNLQRDIERLSKSYKEIKGVTKKRIIMTERTYTKDEKSVTERDKKIQMEKIEIYDFENLDLLKVILAHELGHLVGVGHVDTPGTLMHSYLQEEQIKNLSLTFDDVEAFRECFKK